MKALDSETGRTPIVPEDIARGLPALIGHAESALAPLGDKDLVAQLTAVSAVMGIGATATEKEEWIMGAALQLCQFPGGLVREALQTAPQELQSLKTVVKFVVDYCEDYPARMQRRLDSLVRLQQLAKEQHPHV